MIQIIDSDSPETAWDVHDYPYGFRLRTQIRYWVETKEKEGQRFVSQTLNPKTGKWNEPKKSTYSPVVVMYEESEGEENPGYVHSEHLPRNKEDFIKFMNTWMLDEFQEKQAKAFYEFYFGEKYNG